MRAFLAEPDHRRRGRLHLDDPLRWRGWLPWRRLAIPIADVARVELRTEGTAYRRPVRYLDLLLHDARLVHFEVRSHDGIAEWFWARGIPADPTQPKRTISEW